MSLSNTIKYLINHPINKRKKLKALLKFIQWQIGCRILPGEIIYSWVNGAKVVVKRGETGMTGNVYCGLHEFNDMAFLLHSLQKDDLFIDIGSNVGSYTILASAVIGAKSVSFEPIPTTYEKLCTNIKLNNLENKVLTYNLGLGETEGLLQFTSNKNCCNHAIAQGESSKHTVDVQVKTLDQMLIKNPSIIKIDVEGYETLVLNGGEETLQNSNLYAVIMELNGSGSRYGFDEQLILEKMLAYGFQTYSYEPYSRQITSLNNKKSTEGNTLFIRNIEAVQKQTKKSDKFDIDGVWI